jgi:hypothetical protein
VTPSRTTRITSSSAPFRYALRAELRELLREDPSFRRELVDLIKSELGSATDELLDVEGFAVRRRLNRDTVARMARAGRIAGARKDGREWRLPANAEIAPASATERSPRRGSSGPVRRRPAAASGAVEAMLAYAHGRDAA